MRPSPESAATGPLPGSDDSTALTEPRLVSAMFVVPPLKSLAWSPSPLARVSLFVNIGERTNVTGSKAFARLILAGQFEEALPSRASRWKTAPRSSTSTWTRPCSTARPPWWFLNLMAGEPEIAACR